MPKLHKILKITKKNCGTASPITKSYTSDFLQLTIFIKNNCGTALFAVINHVKFRHFSARDYSTNIKR